MEDIREAIVEEALVETLESSIKNATDSVLMEALAEIGVPPGLYTREELEAEVRDTVLGVNDAGPMLRCYLAMQLAKY